MIATFSICAIDPATGVVGAAVASRYPAVGALVPYVQAGVGAILTQSIANPLFGSRGLELLAEGGTPSAVLEQLLEDDPDRDIRQLAVLDREGIGATWSGPECIPIVAEASSPGVVALGNTLAAATVPREMVEACRATMAGAGAPAHRVARALLAALVAGEAAGGDSRGKQAAALLVRGPGAGYRGQGETAVDLRVDDHPEPVRELARIFEVFLEKRREELGE